MANTHNAPNVRWVETVDLPIDSLQPYPGNPRKHDENALDESVTTNGQYRAIVARRLPDGTHQILAGHGTCNAVARTGAATVRVEVIEADDRAARRIVLADNRTSELATYDDTLLLDVLDAASRDGGFLGTGWDTDAYRELLDSIGSENPFDGPGGSADDADEQDATPPKEPVTQLGDLWLVGPHRVLCGSALDRKDIDRVLDGGDPGIVYTDPPYGIDIVQGKAVGGGGPVGGKAANPNGKVIKTTVFKPVIGDETTDTAVAAFTLAWSAFPKAMHAWWGANHYGGGSDLPDASCWLVWDKQNDGTNFADAELAWTNHPGAVRIFRHMWNGMLRASERGERVHPNQKPAALAAWALDLLDPKHERRTVLDVFGGSGSTALGAHVTSREARIIELDPGYVDVICRRLQETLGELPFNERLGEPVDLIARSEG